MDLTADRLRELLHYDPLTGAFTWLKRIGGDRLTNSWNARYAGARAGSIERKKGYVYISINDENYSAARLAWLYCTGAWPADVIDHINGIRADDKFSNLREATWAQNATNRRGYGRSGLKGAFRYPEHGACRWRSTIRANGEVHQLGVFETAEDANAAYREAAVRLHGEFARLE